MERLSKYLARCGVSSRREAEKLIVSGKVKVNEKVINILGTKIDPKKDKVSYKGKQIEETNYVYYLLNKPKGYIATTKDPYAKKVVTELVPRDKRVFPVGRLDKDTTGLLILTNDGDLTEKLTHPRYEKEKEYHVVIGNSLSVTSKDKLENGIKLEEGKTAPAKVRFIEKTRDKYKYSITIKEGKNRQIRRMLENVGHAVIELERIRVDFLTLGKLKNGDYRILSNKETERLKDERQS